MYTLNPKATTEIIKRRVIANKLTNYKKKGSINPKVGRKRKKGTKNKAQIENKL